MREIKFRAWDKRAKKMYQVEDLGVGKGSWQKTATNYKEQPDTGYNKFYPTEVEIMQYTGLKDKNGVEIYEGDIVKIKCYDKNSIGKVVFNTAHLEYNLIDKDNFYSEIWDKSEPEVIGNIYDNPELLEEK